MGWYDRVPASGPQGPPLLELTYGALAASAAASRPGAVYLIDRGAGVRLTYGEFGREVRRLAAALLAAGVGTGDRVAMLSENCWRWPVVQFAVPAIGAWLVNLHAALKAPQLAGQLAHAEPRLVLLNNAKTGRLDLGQSLREALELLDDKPSLLVAAEPDRLEALGWEEFLAEGESVSSAELDARMAVVGVDDVNLVCYTGGTTSSPRGVLRTHRNLVNHPRLMAQAIGLTEQDVHCTDFRLWHTAGMDGGSSLALAAGCRFVIPSPVFDPAATLRALEEEACTVYSAVPTILQRLVEHPLYDPGRLQLRTVVCGGMHCPPDLMRRLKDELQVYVCLPYGGTEAGVVTLAFPEDGYEAQTSTVGRPLPGRAVKIVDPETGRTLPSGEAGEVCASGLLMEGYYRDPQRTREVIDGDGWYHTRDIGYLRMDGFLVILGRADDAIIRGGENVFPAEVKAVLREHPSVVDAEVVPVVDATYGAEIAAWVKTSGDLDEVELTSHCRARLAFYQVPRWFLAVDDFPLTGAGKHDTNALRQLAEERLAGRG